MDQWNEKITYIKHFDPDGAARLERLTGKKDNLRNGNVYGERFTERQFSLVFVPLLDATFERARVLEQLTKGDDTVIGLAGKLGMGKEKVFTYIKELMRKNLVEIAGHAERDAIFKRKV